MENKDPGGRRRYTVSELCQLRLTMPIVICAISRINKHPDIGKSSATPALPHLQSPKLRSDNFIAGIFTLPEDALKAPVRFSCETKKLANLSKKPTIPQTARRLLVNTSEESEYQNKPQIGASGESHHGEWNFRKRREDSERSSQPFSAPSGLVAQQSENFQRFYRAVISPTHVRVTAGGRIVPNTRVTAPPIYEWNPEKQHFEPAQSPPDESNHPQPTFWPTNTSAPTFPSFPPPPPNGIMTQYQLLPPPGNMLPMMAHQFMDKKPFEGETDLRISGETVGAAPQPIKISPPGQFDQTKPFMYNGQLVYPVPQGFQPPANAMPVPIAMLGNPNFMQGPAGAPPGFYPPPLPMPMPNMPMPNMPFMFPPAHQFQMQAPQPFGYPPQFMGLPSMMSVSELTKNQLNDLNHLLRSIDHQLTNNQHQIDVGHMLRQRAHVESQIDTMQSILKGQLSNEMEMNSHAGVHGESASESSEHNPSTPAQSQVVLASTSASRVQKPAAVVSGAPTTSVESPSHEKVQSATKSMGPTSRAASNSISRLSAAAAMAPPFQPRSVQQPNTLQTSLEGKLSHSMLKNVSNTTAGYDSRGTYTMGWHTREGSVDHASFSGIRGLLDASPDMSGSYVGLQRSHTFHGQTAAGMAMTVASGNQPPDVPYLIGTLPEGLNASEATHEDLTYSRPLTDEEVRARYLYWGKAPRHVQSGLPKFDGKDFYPPSPVKNAALMVTPKGPRITGRPVLPDFTNLFAENRAPGYKTPSPARPPVLNYGQIVAAEESAGKPSTPRRYFTDSLGSAQTISGDRYSSKHVTQVPDFSKLFLEPGVPGYKVPSPPRPSHQTTVFANTDNPAAIRDWNAATSENVTPVKNDENSDTSTVGIRLSPQVAGSPKGKGQGIETPFAERVANFSK